MDSIRSCFTTLMWLWGRDRPPVPVRWFFAEPGAKLFPYAHSFWNVDWEMDKGYKGENDLIDLRGNYANGSTFVHYPGQEFHGPAQAYLDGGRWGIDPPLTTGPDGAIPDCRIPPGSPAGWTVMSGGQGQGGSQHACGLLGYGMLGGQAQGGTHIVCTGIWVTMSGGQAQGGTSTVPPPHVVMMSGGQAQGGTQPAFGGAKVSMSGGQAQGGTHLDGDHYIARMSGGQAQGGTQPFSDGLQCTMSGGQAQGGTQPAFGGANVTMSGGQAQGGTQTASGGCSVDALYVAGWVWEAGDVDGYFQVPAEAEDGDLLVMIVTATEASVGLGYPLDWMVLGAVGDMTFDTSISVLYTFKSSGTTMSGIISPTPSAALVQAVIAVRGAGVPYMGTGGFEASNPRLAPSVDVADACSLLLAAFGDARHAGSATDPSDGMLDAISPEAEWLAVWYQQDVPSGPSGDRTADLDGVDVAGVQIICPPA